MAGLSCWGHIPLTVTVEIGGNAIISDDYTVDNEDREVTVSSAWVGQYATIIYEYEDVLRVSIQRKASVEEHGVRAKRLFFAVDKDKRGHH